MTRKPAKKRPKRKAATKPTRLPPSIANALEAWHINYKTEMHAIVRAVDAAVQRLRQEAPLPERIPWPLGDGEVEPGSSRTFESVAEGATMRAIIPLQMLLVPTAAGLLVSSVLLDNEQQLIGGDPASEKGVPVELWNHLHQHQRHSDFASRVPMGGKAAVTIRNPTEAPISITVSLRGRFETEAELSARLAAENESLHQLVRALQQQLTAARVKFAEQHNASVRRDLERQVEKLRQGYPPGTIMLPEEAVVPFERKRCVCCDDYAIDGKATCGRPDCSAMAPLMRTREDQEVS